MASERPAIVVRSACRTGRPRLGRPCVVWRRANAVVGLPQILPCRLLSWFMSCCYDLGGEASGIVPSCRTAHFSGPLCSAAAPAGLFLLVSPTPRSVMTAFRAALFSVYLLHIRLGCTPGGSAAVVGCCVLVLCCIRCCLLHHPLGPCAFSPANPPPPDLRRWWGLTISAVPLLYGAVHTRRHLHRSRQEARTVGCATRYTAVGRSCHHEAATCALGVRWY